MNNENSKSTSNPYGGLIEKYLTMKRKQEVYFFDVEEFEILIDFHLEKANEKEALEIIEIAKKQYPFTVLFDVRLAQILGAKGKIKQALSILNKIESLDPTDEEFLITRASLYSLSREHKKAISDLESAIEYCEDDIDELYLDLALQYQNIDDWLKSEDWLKKGLKLNPRNEAFIFELAHVYESSNRIVKGVKFFKSFLNNNPYHASAWFNLGNLYAKSEFFNEALESYNYCLAIEKDFGSALFNRANAYVNLKQYDKAIEDYQETLNIEGDDSMTLCYLGECHEKLNNIDKAIFYFEEAIALDKNNDEAWFGKGLCFDSKGNTEEGIEYIQKALELKPVSDDYWYVLAAGYLKINLINEAEFAYDKAAHFTETNYHIYNDYCDHLLRMKKYEVAVEELNEGLKKCSHSSLKNRLAAIKHLMGQEKESMSLLKDLFNTNELNHELLLKISPRISSTLWLINIHLN